MRLGKHNRLWATKPVLLAPQTSQLVLTLLHSVGAPVRTRIVLDVDGVEYRVSGCTAVHPNRVPYRLCYTLPHGFFGDRAFTRRLGEQYNRVRAWLEMEWLGGVVSAVPQLRQLLAPAPPWAFHSSVAFDAATDAQETNGDGTLSLSHTAAGDNRAAFALGGWTQGALASTSLTYNAVGMTELWDILQADRIGNAGYRLAGIPTGAQTVTHVVTSTSGDQALAVVSLTGVDQTTPVGTPESASGAAATSASVTVAGVGADDLVVDAITTDNGDGVAPVVGANQTQRTTEHPAWVGSFHATSSQAGADGGVMSWTFSSRRFCLGAVNFIAASGIPAGVLAALSSWVDD